MGPVDPARYSETQRMELRGLIRLASEVIAQYWPMRTFVHHNPLHSLEYLPFDEAVQRGQQFLRGNGYLPCEIYRRYFRAGRIQSHHLEDALKPLACDKPLLLGTRRISHSEVLRVCLTEGLGTPSDEPLEGGLDAGMPEHLIEPLSEHLAISLKPPSLIERMSTMVLEDQAGLGRRLSLSQWCDRTLGTQTVNQTNGELIKWCEAFLDEGHAAWAMPGRDRGFYEAWKFLAAQEWSPCGIAGHGQKIAQLPSHPEDALLESLETLALPRPLWQDYLSLELAALPGWAGFIKWRAEEGQYPWQQAHPVGLVKYLAVRLWYERELVQAACHDVLRIDGSYPAMLAYMQSHAHAYFLRTARIAGRLPAAYAERVDRGWRSGNDAWVALAERYQADCGPRQERAARRAAGRRLIALAEALQIAPGVLIDTPPADLKVVLDWMDALPEAQHGPVWLKAFEAGYHEPLLHTLAAHVSTPSSSSSQNPPVMRPDAQAVFCLDVRSEPFRRHLEAVGSYETYGFAGFFAVFIRYRAWGKEHHTDQYPVIMRAKNVVREIPRTYREAFLSKHRSRAKAIQAGHTLLHDLKEHVVTPYVMVESLGWFYGLPIIGKTVMPALYRRWTTWLHRLFVPAMATSLTVDKIAPAEIEEMLASEQRAIIRRALRERLGLHGSRVAPEFIEALRCQALNGDGPMDPVLSEGNQRLPLSPAELVAFIEVLRRDYRLDRRWVSARRERITRTGFTLEEQVFTVDTALRMMGLTKGFARLVLFCGHGSTTENNPFESALDCGACGGNAGSPNARVLAVMANNPHVRKRLADNGIDIPSDTHFLAGQVDTTTDDLQLFDLEDVPTTHRKGVARLLEDLQEAGRLTSQERCARLPDVGIALPLPQAVSHVRRRTADWSQVRPEWGLSGNTAFIIGRRAISKGLNLNGRVFLHSYDYREDPTDRLLEVLMTAPQVVAQWINMEHYFSTVDNEVYGSGSKIFHNVVGRLGIMSGPWSDLRLGLAWQTIMNGEMPYHEPMRLLTIIEAPRRRLEKLIARHEMLQHFYHNEWVHLVALDPDGGILFRYLPTGQWQTMAASASPDSLA